MIYLIFKLILLLLTALFGAFWLERVFEKINLNSRSYFGSNLSKTGLKFSREFNRVLPQILYGQSYTKSGGGFNFKYGYKFYPKLLNSLMSQRQVFGAPIQKSCFSLREILAEDLRFERQLQGHWNSSVFQMLALGAMTWVFALACWYLAGIVVSEVLVLIGFLQLFGLGIFVFYYCRQKSKVFAEMQGFYEVIIGYPNLSQTTLSTQEVFQLLPVSKVSESRDSDLILIKETLLEFLREFCQNGRANREGFKLLLSEINFIQSEKFRNFSKKVLVLKLLVSVLFFFSGYLGYVLALVGQLTA